MIQNDSSSDHIDPFDLTSFILSQEGTCERALTLLVSPAPQQAVSRT